MSLSSAQELVVVLYLQRALPWAEYSAFQAIAGLLPLGALKLHTMNGFLWKRTSHYQDAADRGEPQVSVEMHYGMWRFWDIRGPGKPRFSICWSALRNPTAERSSADSCHRTPTRSASEGKIRPPRPGRPHRRIGLVRLATTGGLDGTKPNCRCFGPPRGGAGLSSRRATLFGPCPKLRTVSKSDRIARGVQSVRQNG